MQESKQPYEAPVLSVIDVAATAEGGIGPADGDTGAFVS